MIQIAVIGAGHWGPNLIRNFHAAPRSRVRYVVDASTQRLEQLSSRFPDVELTTRLSTALEDKTVDAVVVATPTATHHDIAAAALAAGKHVLVEKPIAASAADAKDLADLAQKHQRTLMVGHVFLFNSGIRYVKQVLEKNDLGRVHYVSMVRTNLGPIRLDVDAAFDLAAHDISIANYLLGANAVTASAVGGSYINPGISDVVFATLRYPGDVLVNLHASWMNPRKARDITVVGDKKMLTFDDMNLQEPVRLYDKGVAEPSTVADTFVSFRASIREGDVTIPRVPLGEPLKAECDHFLEAIAHGRQPLTDAKLGIEVVQTLEAIQRSLRHGGGEEHVS